MDHSEGFLRLVANVRVRIKEVGALEAHDRQLTGSARLIDVREDHEWTEAHAQGAVHLGKGIIERDIEKEVPDKDSEIILYCGGGYRSALAVDALQQMGYRNVLSLAGGWRAWKEAGLPVENNFEL